MTEVQNTNGRIVVGFDGSSSALAALAWATRQAKLTGGELEVVTAWEWPKSYGFATPIPDNYQPEEEARKILEPAVEKARAEHPGVSIHASVREGYPIQVLMEASRDAELLVVGSRGHGELAGMLIGSVSAYCVAHSPCPVVVLRT